MVVVTAKTSELKEIFLENLVRECEKEKPLTDELEQLQQKAKEKLLSFSLPSKNDEEWRFTDISELFNYEFKSVEAINQTFDISAFILPEAKNSRLVFVNGVYAAGLSDVSGLPTNVYVGNLSELAKSKQREIIQYLETEEKDIFTRLNTVGLKDVAIVWAEANAVLDTPIHLLFLTEASEIPRFSQPRILVLAERGSSLNLVEHYGSITDGCSDVVRSFPYFTNVVTEIYLAENAQVTHSRIQRESGDGFQIANSIIAQSKDSRYSLYEINLGAKFSRHNLFIQQQGEQTETYLNGLTMIEGKQLADSHSIVSLNQPHGTVNQLHKFIIDGSAQGVFNGKIIVPKQAQLTNASQLNRNLILSPKGRVNTKPELQITADNVKCSHGATVSQLETEEIFYLRSRGLNESEARYLLIDAFAAEILDRLPLKSLQQRLTQCVACREGF